MHISQTFFISTLIHYMLDILTLSVLSFSFLGNISFSYFKRIPLIFLPSIFFPTIASAYLPIQPLLLYIELFIDLLFILIVFGQSLIHSVLVLVLVKITTIIIHILEISIYYMITKQTFSVTDYLPSFIAFMIALLASANPFLKRIYKYLITKNFPLSFLLINAMGVILVLNVYSKLISVQNSVLFLTMYVPLFLLISSDIIIIKDYSSRQIEHEKIAFYQKYIPVIEEMLEQIRLKQHQFNNEVQTFVGMADIYKDYNSLSKAIKSYAGEISNDNNDANLLKLNQRFLAAFLFQKLRWAKSQNILVKCNIISTTTECKVNEYVMIEIIGILFDNMIEATPKGCNCKLDIEISEKEFLVTTTNPGDLQSPVDPAKIFSKGFSTKEHHSEKRGYGLYNLKQIVNENGGKIFLENRISFEEYIVEISVRI